MDEKKLYRYFLFFALSIFLFVSLRYARQGFWFDELCSIGFVGKGNTIADTLKYYLTIEVTNVPLYSICLYWWYRIFPASEPALLALSVIATFVGVLYCIRLAKRIKGYKCATITGTLLVTSATVLENVEWELRAYAFLFMFSSMLLFYYYEYRRLHNIKAAVKLGIVMTLLLFTHYFGGIEIAILGITDLILSIKNKFRDRIWYLYYIIPAVLFTPWFVMAMKMKQWNLAQFWPQNPGIYNIVDILEYLLDDNRFLVMLFGIGFISSLIRRFFEAEYTKEDSFVSLISLNFWGVITAVFIYSSKLNPMGSIWVNRYFLGLLPYMAIIIAYGVCRIFEQINFNTAERLGLVYTIIIGGYFSLLLLNYSGAMMRQEIPRGSEEAFKEVAQVICEDEDDVVFVYSKLPLISNNGWREMYFTKPVVFYGSDNDNGTGMLESDEVKRVYVPGLHDEVLTEDEQEYFEREFHEVWRKDNMNLTLYERNE